MGIWNLVGTWDGSLVHSRQTLGTFLAGSHPEQGSGVNSRHPWWTGFLAVELESIEADVGIPSFVEASNAEAE